MTDRETTKSDGTHRDSDQPPRFPFVEVDVSTSERDEASEVCWTLGAQGIEERDSSTLGGPKSGLVLVAYFPDEKLATEAAATLSDRFPARVECLVGDEWRDNWRRFFRPTRIGPRLVIHPTWETPKLESGDVAVALDPGRAFGSGLHETTRSVLREIVRRITGGETILDVGCGSGILAIAALRLGARHAVAIDIDEAARDVTLENAALNQVADRIRASTKPIQSVTERYDFVVANIQAHILSDMVVPLTRTVAPGGILVLSGILRDQVQDVERAYSSFVRASPIPVENEWAALVLGGQPL